MSASCPLIGEEGGWRKGESARRRAARCGRPRLRGTLAEISPMRRRRLSRSRRPISIRCCGGSAMRASCCSARPRTAHREFYRMRERITRELIAKKGFRFVAIEGDWPDAARVDHYVRHIEYPPSEWTAFARFPTWMWRNAEVREFVDWLRKHNGTVETGQARRLSRPRSLQPLRFDPRRF